VKIVFSCSEHAATVKVKTRLESLMASSIPVIDISPLLAGPNDPSRALASLISAWDSAFSTVGFAIITGYGVAPTLPDTLRSAAREFFAQTEESKLRYRKNEWDFSKGGYVPMGVIAETTKEGVVLPPDLVESIVYLLGRCDPSELPPGIHDLALDYCKQMSRLVKNLMRLSAMSLELESDYFARFYTREEFTLRLAHYPPQLKDRPETMPIEGEYFVLFAFTNYLITFAHLLQANFAPQPTLTSQASPSSNRIPRAQAWKSSSHSHPYTTCKPMDSGSLCRSCQTHSSSTLAT
jgi:hypothetical protein